MELVYQPIADYDQRLSDYEGVDIQSSGVYYFAGSNFWFINCLYDALHVLVFQSSNLKKENDKKAHKLCY